MPKLKLYKIQGMTIVTRLGFVTAVKIACKISKPKTGRRVKYWKNYSDLKLTQEMYKEWRKTYAMGVPPKKRSLIRYTKIMKELCRRNVQPYKNDSTLFQ